MTDLMRDAINKATEEMRENSGKVDIKNSLHLCQSDPGDETDENL